MNRIGAKNQWNHWTSDLPPSGAGRPRSATTDPCHRPRIVPASQTRSHHDQRATSPPWHPGTLPIETPMLPTPFATPATRDDVPSLASGAGQAESPLGSRPSRSSIPASARAHPHACWNAAGCAIHAATWTDELCNSEPTLVHSSSADEPTSSDRRQRMTSHATALGADQRHRERAVLARSSRRSK